MTNIQNLVETLKAAYAGGYRYFGVRKVYNYAGIFNVGDSCPKSYNWDFENDCSTYDTTGETLPGTSAIHVAVEDLYLHGDDDDEAAEALQNAIDRVSDYGGEQMLLIGSKYSYDYGDDEDEVILEDADVLAIID